MAMFELNNSIKFLIPAGFNFSKDINKDGNEYLRVEFPTSGNGFTGVNSGYNVINVEYDYFGYGELAPDVNADNLLDSVKGSFYGNGGAIQINENFKTLLFGNTFKHDLGVISMYAKKIISLIQITDRSVLTFWNVVSYDTEQGKEDFVTACKSMYKLLQSVRIFGRKLNLGTLSLQEYVALRVAGENDREKYRANNQNQNKPKTSAKRSHKSFTRQIPDISLYPHYNRLKSSGNIGIPGVQMVVNSTGAEYEFIQLANQTDNEDLKDDLREVCKRLATKNTAVYSLDTEAKEMQKLFHVSKSAFDPKHDRECEIEEGLLHRAYMMSALRSFAWTLSDYCKKCNCTPEDVDVDVLTELVKFIAAAEWLNYDGTTYCKCLCSGQDLHVYFVPDGISQADKKRLLPSDEDYNRIKEMKNVVPTYEELLPEINSLEDLRNDLKYILPAVKKLWNKLKDERNYDEALVGDEADVVYAWCSLAHAARGPIYYEDGPMTCFFTQMDTQIPPTSSTAPKKTGAAKKKMSTQSNTAADKTAARKESDAKLQAILDEQRENATVNMYIILTNEKKLGKLRRNQNEFYDLYKKHLVFFTKKVLFQTRKSIIEEMKDESRCSYYEKKFMQRSVEERFKISTKNLFDVDDEPDLDKMADWAIRNTKEWYREDEYFKVRKLMDSELLNARLELDKANKGIDLRWTKFALAKDNCLRIEINDELLMSGEAPKDLSKTDYSYFEVRVGEQLVSVRLQSNRIYTAPVLRNIYVWYWNVTVRDIWEAAALNEIYNFSRASISQRSVVNQAMNIIRSKYPDMKTDVLSSAEKSKAQEARPQYGYTETDKTNTVNSAPQYSQPLQQPEQKEGCYIATAVYGSYDAPEVIVLRRFRDESLKKSALGRSFIRAYYKFSPSVAERLKNAKRTNAFVRSILDKWVRKISNK